MTDVLLTNTHCSRICLHVKIENSNALEFYKNKQFHVIERCSKYYTIDNEYFDALFLEKIIKLESVNCFTMCATFWDNIQFVVSNFCGHSSYDNTMSNEELMLMADNRKGQGSGGNFYDAQHLPHREKHAAFDV